jgi:hypothetical protein
MDKIMMENLMLSNKDIPKKRRRTSSKGISIALSKRVFRRFLI